MRWVITRHDGTATKYRTDTGRLTKVPTSAKVYDTASEALNEAHVGDLIVQYQLPAPDTTTKEEP